MTPAKHKATVLLVQVALVFFALFSVLIVVLTYRTVRDFPEPQDLARLLGMKTPIIEDFERGGVESETSEDQKSAAPMREKQLLTRLLELGAEDPKDIRVCDHLGQTALPVEQNTLESKDILRGLFSQDRTDSVSEAFRIPMREVFSNFAVRELLSELRELEGNAFLGSRRGEWRAFFEKVRFYVRVGWAAMRLNSHRTRLEALGNRAMHLYALTRLAQLKPELMRSSALIDVCQEILSRSRAPSHAEIVRERNEVLKHFKSARVAPEQIGWSPEQWIELQVQARKDGFKLNLIKLGEGQTPSPSQR